MIHLLVIQMYSQIYQCPFHSSMSSDVTKLLSYVRFSSTCMATVLLARLTSFPLVCPSSLHSALYFPFALAFLLTLWVLHSYPRCLSSLQETEFLSFCLIIPKSSTGVHVSFQAQLQYTPEVCYLLFSQAIPGPGTQRCGTFVTKVIFYNSEITSEDCLPSFACIS